MTGDSAPRSLGHKAWCSDGGMLSNKSFDTDTHRQCVARRVDKPTPCGALPVRADQLRRWA